MDDSDFKLGNLVYHQANYPIDSDSNSLLFLTDFLISLLPVRIERHGRGWVLQAG